MIDDLFDCRKRALERSNIEETSNAGRHGYMKTMKLLWEAKGYASLNLTAQNLRDTVARYEKKQKLPELSSNVDNYEANERQIDVGQGNGERMGHVVLVEIATASETSIINQVPINERQVDVGEENGERISQPAPDEGITVSEPSINDQVQVNIESSYLHQGGILNSVNMHITDSNVPLHNNSFNDAPNEEPSFKWNEVKGDEFCARINDAYEEIVHWKRNVFLIPSGRSGKSFVQELARLYQSYADASPLDCISLKACSVMQSLLLQKPFVKSKTKDHANCLERRLNLWLKGDIKALVNEGRCIQKHLISQTNQPLEFEKITRGFSRLMLQGKVHQAVRLISNADKGGLLSLDALLPNVDGNGNATWRSTRDVLLEKHPEANIPSPEVLLPNTEADEICFDPVVFERITGETIKQAAMRTNGSAGPSGVDAYGWRRFCSSFKGVSVDLCNALAGVAKRLCTTQVDSDGLSAYVACRLIPLNKDPGVRPIGVGEVPRRIVAKAILKAIGEDVKSAAGALQTCAGHEAGCEAAIHAMKEIESMDDTEAMLLVDATNAFNTLNRKAALHNIGIICPAISTVLNNTYSKPVRLFVTGGDEILSSEGTTQGDPLAMAMYALAITPLINSLSHETSSDVKQVWFADDSTSAGKLHALRGWWQHLTTVGPEYGYYPNPAKTTLVVKPEYIHLATALFENTGIRITTAGHNILGAAIGTSNFVQEYVAGKVEMWKEEINVLAKIAEIYPHAAYAAFIHSIKGKWQFIMRTVEKVDELFQPIEEIITEKLIPALTGRSHCSIAERKMLSLPTRHGGLNIVNPVEEACHQFHASKKITEPLKQMIIEQADSYRRPDLSEIKTTTRREKAENHANKANAVREMLPATKQRTMDLLNEKGSSSWLTVLPLKEHGFDLNKSEFRDALCLRYGWQLKNLPQHCVCGANFSTDHAMICSHGGMTIVRHNEIRDITADWLSEVCNETEKEPQLQPITGESIYPQSANRQDEARSDIKAKGFWCRQQSAFFDVRVFHPNAPSYRNTSISSLYRSQENMKKREYGDRVREIEHGTFTPLIFSTSGGLSKETTIAYKRMAEMLAVKWKWEYAVTLAWMRCRLSFALLRSAIACMRGTRKSPNQVKNKNLELGLLESQLRC